MAISFKSPGKRKRTYYQVTDFRGVDYTNDSGSVTKDKSPNAPNMIRDVPRKVRKCMGYHLIKEYSDRINGFHLRRGDTEGLIHTGTNLIKENAEEPLYTTAQDDISVSFQFGDKLYIIDGKRLLVYDGTTVVAVEDDAYIPTLTIAKAPNGGGTDYEALNLLQPKFTELFAGVASVKDYMMTFDTLDEVEPVVELLNASGEWTVKTITTDYTIDYAAGKISFVTAPGVSPITGEDNVRITVSRTVEGYADRINKCSIGVQFGVNGASDRLFLSGNPEYINYDWCSDMDDPTYWPDVGYSVLGTKGSAIVGYSIINNYLAVHKDSAAEERNIIIREGNLIDNEPSFPQINTLQGPGAIAKHSFSYLATEPIFLTSLGVYAVTPSDINGEKYAQNRSYYIDGALLKESNLKDAFAITYKDLYFLCVNGKAFILDGLQPLETDKNKPYSTRLYACFYRTNLPARVLWQQDGVLYFGTSGGQIMAFYTDPESPESYNDNGAAISCLWDTPDFSGGLFWKNKTFRNFAVSLIPSVASSIKIWGQRRGIWSLLKTDETSARYFAYDALNYEKFTYSNDETAKTIPARIRIKKVDKTRFRFGNDVLNEPFGLMAYGFEYAENGNYRG